MKLNYNIAWNYFSLVVVVCGCSKTYFEITGVYTWINTYREGNNFPLGDDLNGAAQALVRLQDTYQLDMTSLADGIVKPSQSSKDSSWSFSTDVSGKALLVVKPKLFQFHLVCDLNKG